MLNRLVQTFLPFVNFATMIRATAHLPGRADRPFVTFEGETYTDGETYARTSAYARFLLAERQRRIAERRLGVGDRLRIGLYMDNRPEYQFAVFGAGLSNSILFAFNPGFRGSTLAGVMEQADVALVLADARALDEVERAVDPIENLDLDAIRLLGGEGR